MCSMEIPVGMARGILPDHESKCTADTWSSVKSECKSNAEGALVALPPLRAEVAHPQLCPVASRHAFVPMSPQNGSVSKWGTHNWERRTGFWGVTIFSPGGDVPKGICMPVELTRLLTKHRKPLRYFTLGQSADLDGHLSWFKIQFKID